MWGFKMAKWDMKKLGDVCEIKPPKAEARRKLADHDLVSFVPMEDLGIEQKFVAPTQTRQLSDVAGSYTYFADGDVLLAKITPCFENGKLGIATNLTNGIGFGSSEYIVFRPNRLLDKEWLYYFLSRDSFRLEGARNMSGSVGHKRVTKDYIETAIIPLPPFQEQQRIVAVLDEAFAGIATATDNAKKNLQNARELFESHLQSIFTAKGDGWVEKTLGDVYDVRDGTHDSPKYHDQGYALITSKNLKRDGLSFEKVQYISEADYIKINERSAVSKGDVLFAMIGTIGTPVVVDMEPNFAIKNVALFKVPNTQNSRFLKYYLDTEVVKKKMDAEAKGTTQRFVGLGYLRSFPIYIPPLPEQQRIVTQLDALSAETKRLEAIYQQKLDNLAELKQSILQKAFAGELNLDKLAA